MDGIGIPLDKMMTDTVKVRNIFYLALAKVWKRQSKYMGKSVFIEVNAGALLTSDIFSIKQLLLEDLLLRQLPTEKLIEEYYAEKMKEMVGIHKV